MIFDSSEMTSFGGLRLSSTEVDDESMRRRRARGAAIVTLKKQSDLSCQNFVPLHESKGAIFGVFVILPG